MTQKLYILCFLFFVPLLAMESVLVEGIPHIKQKPDFCGEACVAMYLQKLGKEVSQDDVFNFFGLSPVLGRGCYTPELAQGLQKMGFAIGNVWYQALADFDDDIRKEWQQLYNDLRLGVPNIVCMRYSETSSNEHFRLIIGYDAISKSIIYHEPGKAFGAYQKMPLSEFLSLWPLKYKKRVWTIIRIPLKLAEDQKINIIKEESRTFTNADYAQHIMKLRQELPHSGFTIVVEPPFVVIGDESAATVRYRSMKTIKWSVSLLKQDYFDKDPDHIINIWLFKDKYSYEQNVEKLFGNKPTAKFGYYSLAEKALVMNIRTGGGTLVHEIVHPFVYANFPECPTWFNEGLASLYEQCTEKDGKIYGLTNWRLKGLQNAIMNKNVSTFKYLTHTTKTQFYQENYGLNYAQARYLCYYLQEKQLLRKFYHEFQQNYENDPTGYETLKKILNESDMDEFHKKWRYFVLDLQF